ncbi:Mrp/NBP35 family ATP-binding protein [Blattabacterium cuenoti]|uniref:Mrp/NBP35 family ATP-binding protein n=1 Tax=Blattabacterium cuenoti TaxID=1653831 RepID=UPI00163BC1D0|nr:Mrp/NBP35 family ATP-binding protein [Blattabacterium cuenoti]
MKKKIEETLKNIFINNKNIIELNFLKKIDVLNNKIIIYLDLPNPTMHLKNKIEKEILLSLDHVIQKKIYIKINVKLNNIKKNSSKIKNIIAIASGKGGVGKSTISSIMAVSLIKMGFNVGLLDADIYGPSIPLIFNIDIHNQSILYKNGFLNPIFIKGLKILSMGFFSKYGQAIVWRGPLVTKVLMQFIYKTNWGDLDFLIIDLPPGTGDIHLSIAQQDFFLKGVVIISTPHQLSFSDVSRTIKMYKIRSINIPILGIIENMSFFFIKKNKYYLYGKNHVREFSKKMNLSFLGEIPFLQEIQNVIDIGIFNVLNNNIIYNNFEKIIKCIINQL